MAKVESSGGTINDVCIFKNSGLMLLALDNGQIPAHFLPALGPAPKWCSYLENLTVRELSSFYFLFYEYYISFLMIIIIKPKKSNTTEQIIYLYLEMPTRRVMFFWNKLESGKTFVGYCFLFLMLPWSPFYSRSIFYLKRRDV
jgi:hypothetical protein